VAFLRRINVTPRRVSQRELQTAFERMGFHEVEVYGGSGNVIFAAKRASVDPMATAIRHGLGPVLGFDVEVFLRKASEVRAIAAREPFNAEKVAASEGTIQLVILASRASQQARANVLAMATADDRLAFDARELYWLPRASTADSMLDRDLIARLVGPMTFRTKRTIEQIAAKSFYI